MAGNFGPATAPLPVTIDTVPPSAPALTGLTKNAGNNVTITGTAAGSAKVAMMNGTTQLAAVTVDTSGAWNWTFALGNAPATLTAVGIDAAGNRSGASGTAQVGGGGANTLTSTAGNDVFYGGAGADTFVFNSTFGQDLIADFTAAGTVHDIVDFHGSSVLNSYASVKSHAATVGTGVVITQDASNRVTLANVQLASLTSSDFTFV